jgi:F-type H+-transporting ATPase subunit a
MGLEFLTRVRTTSLWMGLVTSLFAVTLRGLSPGLGLFAGIAWCLVNLALIQMLVVALTGPERSEPRGLARAAIAIGGMLALFAAGAFLLMKLPAIWLVAGFTFPFLVLVLKAASLLVLPSRAWRTLTRSRWRAGALVAALVAAAWLMTTAGATARHAGTHPAPHATARAAASAAPATPPHEAKAGADEGEEKGPQKFPNVITVLARAMPGVPWVRFLHHYEAIVFSLLIALLLSLVAFAASRNPQMIPGPLQNAVEWLVEKLYNFVVDILGPEHGPRYVPFLGTLFIYILAMNLFGLIPFMDSPTSSLNVTVALALVVFVYSQFIGLRELGVIGYFDHLMGNPRTVIGWLLVPLMLPIHVMGELAKPISLSCRLFGNIFGEDMLLVAFATLGVTTLSFAHLPFGIPWQLPFLFLALLTSTLQALVFTVLSTIYFLLMLPHDDHAHEGEAQHVPASQH